VPYLIQWESEGVYTKFWGHLTSDELKEANRVKKADPRTPNCKYSINDFLEVTRTDATKFDVLMLAAKDHDSEAVSRSLKMAHVIANKELRELSLAYAKSPLAVDTFMVETFYTLEDARKWASS